MFVSTGLSSFYGHGSDLPAGGSDESDPYRNSISLISQLLEASETPGPLSQLVMTGRVASLREGLASLLPAMREALAERVGGRSGLAELVAISEEPDAELANQRLFRMAQRLESSEDPSFSLAVYQYLSEGADESAHYRPPRSIEGETATASNVGRPFQGRLPAEPEPQQGAALVRGRGLRPRSGLKGPPYINREAARRYAAITGENAGTWDRIGYLGATLARQIFNGPALLGMFGAGLTFKVGRVALGRGLGAMGIRGALQRGVATLGAFIMESTAFPLITNAANEAIGRHQDWSSEALRRQIIGSHFVLGGLKLFGGIAGRLAQGAIRRGLARPGGAFQVLAGQGGMYFGTVAGHVGEHLYLGEGPIHWDQTLATSLVTLVHFNAAGGLLRIATPRSLQQMERYLEHEGHRLGQTPRGPDHSGWNPFAPQWVMAMAGEASTGRSGMDLIRGVQTLQMSGNETGGNGPRPPGERHSPEPNELTRELLGSRPSSDEQRRSPVERVRSLAEAMTLVEKREKKTDPETPDALARQQAELAERVAQADDPGSGLTRIRIDGRPPASPAEILRRHLAEADAALQNLREHHVNQPPPSYRERTLWESLDRGTFLTLFTQHARSLRSFGEHLGFTPEEFIVAIRRAPTGPLAELREHLGQATIRGGSVGAPPWGLLHSGRREQWTARAEWAPLLAQRVEELPLAKMVQHNLRDLGVQTVLDLAEITRWELYGPNGSRPVIGRQMITGIDAALDLKRFDLTRGDLKAAVYETGKSKRIAALNLSDRAAGVLARAQITNLRSLIRTSTPTLRGLEGMTPEIYLEIERALEDYLGLEPMRQEILEILYRPFEDAAYDDLDSLPPHPFDPAGLLQMERYGGAFRSLGASLLQGGIQNLRLLGLWTQNQHARGSALPAAQSLARSLRPFAPDASVPELFVAAFLLRLAGPQLRGTGHLQPGNLEPLLQELLDRTHLGHLSTLPPPGSDRDNPIYRMLRRHRETQHHLLIPDYHPVWRDYGGTSREVDVSAGVRRVRQAIAAMDSSDLEGLRELAVRGNEQPWLLAGVSDGIGFQAAVALLASGLMTRGVGVFYEHPALLEAGSPVHLSRLANVEGLRILASERGANFPILFEDLVVARHGHPEGHRPLPEALLDAMENLEGLMGVPDWNFVDSIAFARWISPMAGVKQRTGVPSVDAQGRVILMDMKPYHERNYQRTLDSMGRNHGLLLHGLEEYFGPDSTSYFFTWAGGSQNRRILYGIYGGGVLGHAKQIGETDTLRMHLSSMEQEMTLGSHRVVRYPAFLSHALLGIPGGGAFGLIARDVLESHGVYQDIPQLAPRTFLEGLSLVHNREHPLAAIELDTAETLFMPEIARRMEIFFERVAEYRATHPEWDGQTPLDLATSRTFLEGLVGEDYLEQLPD